MGKNSPYVLLVKLRFFNMEILLFGSKIFKIISLSNQNDLTLPETIFELLISSRIMVRILQAFLPQLHGEQVSTPKNYLWNQESDVLLNPILERSHQEKMRREI